MGWKKGYIPVNCETQKEYENAQAILEELGSILRLDAKTLIRIAPLLRKNQSLIRQMFSTISNGGIKSIASVVSMAMQLKK